MLHISSISKDRWIYISEENSFNEPDEFVELVKEYQTQLSGSIFEVSKDMQYGIDNDPLKLIFQWDDCFGITIVVPQKTNITMAENVLRDLCEKLNQKRCHAEDLEE